MPGSYNYYTRVYKNLTNKGTQKRCLLKNTPFCYIYNNIYIDTPNIATFIITLLEIDHRVPSLSLSIALNYKIQYAIKSEDSKRTLSDDTCTTKDDQFKLAVCTEDCPYCKADVR